MSRYRIITFETLSTLYEIDIPDDCPDPIQYFYDHEHLAVPLGSDLGEWQVAEIKEIKDGE